MFFDGEFYRGFYSQIYLFLSPSRKAGDLSKYRRLPSANAIRHLIGLDLSQTAVSDARSRYLDAGGNRGLGFDADFYVFDCFSLGIEQFLPNNRGFTYFNACACQFALHYAFESEQKLRFLLDNASRYLAPGGYFFGTTTNAMRLIKLVERSDNLIIGNGIYSVRFEQKYRYRKFGERVWFSLRDAIDNCPEYLVHMPTLVKLAEEYGLKLVLKMGFDEFYRWKLFGDVESGNQWQHRSKAGWARNMFERMMGAPLSEFPVDDWEVACLYLVFAFQKQ